ncbi:MAG: MoxR family ATPase [Chromatiales bacterium]|nr:MoxR family ATPase [Chromatiales bacterium]
MTGTVSALPGRNQQTEARALAERVVSHVGAVVLGKEHEIRLALTCLLAGGHLLIEDVPGVGKTLLARTVASALGLSFRRIQFTSDLLPADVLGMAVFEQQHSRFRFHPGPVFAQLVLADEINRASPRTQSALLEAMEEHQVTVDGSSHPLPEPFFVIATQNPVSQVGTFQLPESQLDRFLMRIGIGYPDPTLERQLLRGEDRRQMAATLPPSIGTEELAMLQRAAHGLHLADPLLDYVQALVRFTRHSPDIALGLSTRGARDLVHAARCWAMIHGHAGVHPEDVKAVFPSVVGHRLKGLPGSDDVVRLVLESVAAP